MSEMRFKRTERGFALYEFVDGDGEAATLQMSSAAEAPHVWLGADAVRLMRFVPGESWSDVPLPEGDVAGNQRLHLTRENVAALLPILKRFVDTGDIEPAAAEDDVTTAVLTVEDHFAPEGYGPPSGGVLIHLADGDGDRPIAVLTPFDAARLIEEVAASLARIAQARGED